jgi:hypothetical protein
MNDTSMAERPFSPHVDPDIFQHLQEKIDEEGKIRDVLRFGMYAADADGTDTLVGAQRNSADP